MGAWLRGPRAFSDMNTLGKGKMPSLVTAQVCELSSVTGMAQLPGVWRPLGEDDRRQGVGVGGAAVEVKGRRVDKARAQRVLHKVRDSECRRAADRMSVSRCLTEAFKSVSYRHLSTRPLLRIIGIAKIISLPTFALSDTLRERISQKKNTLEIPQNRCASHTSITGH